MLTQIYILETIMHRRGLFLESVDQVKIMLNAGKMYSESPRTIWYRIWEITHLIWKLSSMDSLVATFDYFWSFAAYYCALSTLKEHEEKLIFGNQNCTGVRIVLAKVHIVLRTFCAHIIFLKYTGRIDWSFRIMN